MQNQQKDNARLISVPVINIKIDKTNSLLAISFVVKWPQFIRHTK
jgi:hypothetical protein